MVFFNDLTMTGNLSYVNFIIKIRKRVTYQFKIEPIDRY